MATETVPAGAEDLLRQRDAAEAPSAPTIETEVIDVPTAQLAAAREAAAEICDLMSLIVDLQDKQIASTGEGFALRGLAVRAQSLNSIVMSTLFQEERDIRDVELEIYGAVRTVESEPSHG